MEADGIEALRTANAGRGSEDVCRETECVDLPVTLCPVKRQLTSMPDTSQPPYKSHSGTYENLLDNVSFLI